MDKASEYAQRLLDTATEYECHKYQAEAHRIKAHIAGQLDQVELAVAEFQAALQVLEHYPVPVLKWRILGDVGRLEQNRGNHAVAGKALTDALEIVSCCAANVKDEKLRTKLSKLERCPCVKVGDQARTRIATKLVPRRRTTHLSCLQVLLCATSVLSVSQW